MMNKFFVVASFYFLYELIINGLLPTFNPDQDSFDPYANVIQQFYDLCVIAALLFIFRSREWPEYFSVGLLDNPFSDNEAGLEIQERRLAPLLTTVIDEKIFRSNNTNKSSL